MSAAGTGRLVLLSTSPRVAPGLLTGPAWSALRSAPSVAAAAGHPQQP
jgi:XTP/dITP diphosphohydrolase